MVVCGPGKVDWDGGRVSGEVTVEGPERGWPHWLAATGYLLSIEPEAAVPEPPLSDSLTDFFHEMRAAALGRPDVVTEAA